MLGKLIKHEFRSTARNVLLLIIALAVITPLTAVYIRAYNYFFLGERVFIFKMFMVMAVILFVISVIGCFAATTFIMMYRFYKSMVSKEAYLTHTLPVNKPALIFSKIIVAATWHVVTMAVCIFSVAEFTKILGMWRFRDLSMLMKKVLDTIAGNGDALSVFLMVILTVLVSAVASYAQIFFAFSMGQRMNRHPILGTVITYFVYMVAIQTLFSIVSAVGFAILNSGVLNGFFDSLGPVGVINLFFGLVCFAEAVLFAATYLLSIYNFKKKLNI